MLRDRLDGKVALITGASAGIGKGIAEVLADRGAQTVLVARREERLRELAAEIHSGGLLNPIVIAMDLTSAGASRRVCHLVEERCGGIDVLVNNAGGSRPVAIDASESEWEQAFAINFVAPRRLAHECLGRMLERRSGRIINITGSSEPKSLNAANAAKAALHAWSKGLAVEVSRFGINVNCVSPGRIHSEQLSESILTSVAQRDEFGRTEIPAGYIGDPSDVGHTVAFLASAGARYITGEIIHVDGGLRRFAF